MTSAQYRSANTLSRFSMISTALTKSGKLFVSCISDSILQSLFVVVCNLDHCLCKVPMPYSLLSQALFSWFAFTLTFDDLHELLNALSCEDYLGKGADTTLLGSKQCSPSIRQSTHFDVHCTS